MLDRPHLIVSAKGAPALLKAIQMRLQMALDALPVSAREKLKPVEAAEISAWASSNGGFGGVVMVEDGLPWFF